MANNFLNPLNPTNFGLNVTGNFNNLSSAGTFRLPNSDLLNKINSKGGPSKDPIGTVQFSAGGGNFDSNPNIYIRDEELGEADNISVSTAGSGYTVANSVTTTTLTGSGSGLVINIVTVSGGGGISTVLIVNGGLGYVQGDTVSVVGGNGDAVLTIGIIDLPKNRLVLDSRSSSGVQGAPISGLVLIPPAGNPNASFIATDGTVAYFSRFATNYGYSPGDTITLNNPYGGTAAVITVTGTPGVNGQVGNLPGQLSEPPTIPGTSYQANDVLIQVSTSGVGRLFTCTVNSVDGLGGILTYSVGLQYVKDFQGYTEGTGWQSFTSQGGVASAAGANTQIQFNNNGNLGANPGLTLDTSATPITLTSGISGGALSKNIFNSQEFTIEDTASGTARLHIESNQFAGSPAIELSYAPSNNLNAPGIKLSSTNFAGIALEVAGGQIKLTSTGGQINTQTTTGSIRMRRGTAPNNYSTIEIQSGDIFLETDVAGNQIRLTTNNINSDIELSAAQSNIDLTAAININATSESLEVSNNASNGSTINMKGPSNNNNIILTGADGTLQLGAAVGSTGDLQIKNLASDIVVQINVDPLNNGGRLSLSNVVTAERIVLTGNDGIVAATEIAAGGKLFTPAQSYIRLTQPASGDCRIGTQGAATTNLRMTSLQDINTGTGYLAFEQRASTLTTDLVPTDTAWTTSVNRSASRGVFVQNQDNNVLINSNSLVLGPATTTTGPNFSDTDVGVTIGGTDITRNVALSLSCPEETVGPDRSFLANFLSIGGAGGGTAGYQGLQMSYPNLSFQQPGQIQNTPLGNPVYYTSSQQGLTHGFYLRSQISKPSGFLPPTTIQGVGQTAGWLECDLYCGDATFGAPGQGNGGPALTGPILHSEPWAQEITPSPAPITGASGDDVVRPNLSIGAVPRNFYGPTTGVLPRPPGTVTNDAISPYTAGTGVLNTTNKVWTVSIGGNAESYENLPAVPPGNAADTATYIGGGSAADTPFYYPNPGVNLVLNGVSGPNGQFGGKTYINGEILNSNYIAGNFFPLTLNTHASNLILAPDNGGNIVIEPRSSYNPTGVLPGEVQMFLGGDVLGSGAPGGGQGYIRSEYATNPAGGATGPTNICNRNHNGYIGCPGVFPSDGTGIRGYSVLATTFSAAAKLYTAKNQGQQVGEQGFVCCSAVEAPQGVIIMRGRVQLAGFDATVDLDSAQVAPGQLIVPHTNPDAAFPIGTVDAMYQNFTVSVTNAGVLSGAYPELDFDQSPGQVSGIIKISPITPQIKQVSLNIRNFGTTPDIFVDWVVYSERKDVGYKSAGAATPGTGFVTSYTNPVSGTYDTWGTPAYTPGSGAPTNGVDLDSIYGADNYIFE